MTRAPALPFDYMREIDRRRPSVPRDPIDSTLDAMRGEQVRRTILDNPSPDKVAKITRLSRETGDRTFDIEGREDQVDTAQRARAMASLAERYPAIGRFAVANPRAAAAAQDDAESLGVLGSAWDFIKKAPARLGAGVWSLGEGLTNVLNVVEEVEEALFSPVDAAMSALAATHGLDILDPKHLRESAARRRRQSSAYFGDRAAAVRKANQGGNRVTEGLLTGLESVPLTIGAVLTRDPRMAAGVMGGVSGASGYIEARGKDVDAGRAIRYGATQGAIEVVTEFIPAGTLVDLIARKTPWGKAFVRELGQEMAGEQVATVLQDLNAWALLPENAGKTMAEFAAERPGRAIDTALAATGGTAATVGAIGAAQRATDATIRVTDRIGQARQAMQERRFFDRAAKAVEGSKLRQRDPEALRALLREQAEEAGASSVFIPGEAVREYQQSDSYDDQNDPFARFDVDEAAMTGGDIVVPIEDALTDLVGTPAWEALRGDMRLAPGGMSPREADGFDEAMDDVMAELGDQAAQQEQAESGAQTVRDKIVDRVAQMFGVSFTSPTARTIAELFAQRVQTRAERLGNPITGEELEGFEVRQVLPERLARAVSADPVKIDKSLEPLLALMKGRETGVRQRSEKARLGPSLLDWIAAQGGIEDRGGDLKAMGVASVSGRARKGERKLIRPTLGGQASMLGSDGGQNTNSPDELALRAWEAGYFPEFAERPSVNDLLGAIADGISGNDRFAGDNTTADDEVRLAAQELFELLDSQGIDPATVTLRQASEAVTRYQAERMEGLGYDQLFDDPTQPARGMTAEQRAELEARQKQGKARRGGQKAVSDQEGGLFSSERDQRVLFQAAENSANATEFATKAATLSDATHDVEVEIDHAKGGSVYVKVGIHDLKKDGSRYLRNSTKSRFLKIRFADHGQYYGAHLSVDDVSGNTVADAIDLVKWWRDGGKGDGPRIFESSILPEYGEQWRQPVTLRKEGNYIGRSFDGPRELVKSYGQSYGEGPRGRIIFDQNKRIIELFQSRNLSTPLHELSHMWLEELRFDAEQPDAPDQLKADWQTVQTYFTANGHAIGEDGQIPTEAHELWARSGERYFMEGKAPTSALVRMFETFRMWLVNIYKTVDRLRAPISPEIREVFDRLLATDEEIAAAQERQGLAALFKDAATIGMTEPEFQAYQRQVDDARAGAHAALLDKTMRTIRRREQERYSEVRKKIRVEEQERILASPIFKALGLMKDQRISREWVSDTMGGDAIDLLPIRVPPLHAPGGVHPDSVAEQSGYSTGREMIEALIDVERAHRQAKEGGDKRTMRERAIEDATNAEFARRYGDPLNDGSIEREALAAVHSEMQGEVIASELRILSRKTGRRPTPYALAREWARGKVRGGTVAQEASPGAIQRYARNAAKAGRAAEKAMLAQDADEAFRQKQFQMMNSALVAEARAAADEVKSAVKRMDKIARAKTRKSVDQDYLEQAQALLEAVDLRARSQIGIDRQGKWEAFAAARTAEGFDVVVPASFEATINRTHWSRLSIEDLLALDEAVKQVIHLGRLKQTLLDGQERRDREQLFREAEDGAANIKGPPPQGLDDPTWWDGIKARVLGTDAMLLKMETVFDWLDGGNPNGVFNRIVFRPVADAQGRENDMTKDYHGRIKALFEAVPEKVVNRWSDKVAPPFIDRFTGRPMSFSRQKLIMMALNTGNAGNLQRLADGYQINDRAVVNYLANELTAEEWQFVQGVWDTVETLWPEIEGLERRVNGVAPLKVEAVEVDTPHGTFRGGYFPAIYDTTLDRTAQRHEGSNENELFEPNAVRASTRSSSTKERAEKVSRPVLLDLGVINRHLGEVIHDITHREAVMQAWQFLSSERVASVVDQALGREITNQLRPWVKFVANSWAMERAGNEAFGKWIGKLRANVTAVGLGLRGTTMVTQLAGYSNSIEALGENGEALMAEAMARTTASPIETGRFVMAKSAEVRHRLDNLDRDIRTELARINAKNPVTRAAVELDNGKRFLFHGIGIMDRVVVVPTWLAAYNKALSGGMDEAAAIYYADKVVRQSQGSGAPKDMAAISRGTGRWGEALKLFTMFYSFFSAQYQRQRTLGRDVMGRDERRSRDMPRLAARAFWLVIMPPLLVEVLRMSVGAGGGPEDEEGWLQWLSRKTIANQLGPIPIARDTFEPVWNRVVGNRAFNPTISPLQGFYDTLAKTGGNVGKIARGDETKTATKDTLQLAGYVTGLVPGQVASAVQFWVDVSEGDADPEGFWDYWEGTWRGKIEED